MSSDRQSGPAAGQGTKSELIAVAFVVGPYGMADRADVNKRRDDYVNDYEGGAEVALEV